MTRKRTLMATAALVAFLSGCSQTPVRPNPDTETNLTTVGTTAVRITERPRLVEASGVIEAAEHAEFGFEVPGRVALVAVNEGDRVTAGRVLAELNRTEYQQGLAMAQGSANEARAYLAKAKAGSRRQEEAQARAAAAQAEDEYQRMKFLYERKSLAAVDFHKAEAAWTAARERLDEAVEGARQEDKDAAEAGVAQAEAQEQIARKHLLDATLRAPISGFVTKRKVEPGEMVAPGAPVFGVANLAVVKIRAGVPEAEVGWVKSGQPVRVRVPAMPDKEWNGTVELAGIAADEATRTYTVKVTVANQGEVLRPGMVAEVAIETGDRVHALLVPGEAVVPDASGSPRVFLYDEKLGAAVARRVEVGRPVGKDVEIRNGIAEGDRVITAGQHKLSDGEKVRPNGENQ